MAPLQAQRECKNLLNVHGLTRLYRGLQLQVTQFQLAFPLGVFLETLKDDCSELHVHKMCLSLAYHQLRISPDNPGGCNIIIPIALMLQASK